VVPRSSQQQLPRQRTSGASSQVSEPTEDNETNAVVV